VHKNSHEKELPERMLSVKQVASILSVHTSTVRRWEKEALLKAYRVGPRGSVRFDEGEILGFVNGFEKGVRMEHG